MIIHYLFDIRIKEVSDMDNITKKKLQTNIENLEEPQSISTYIKSMELRSKLKQNCKDMIFKLRTKQNNLIEDTYMVNLTDYLRDDNYIGACNCIIIIEALSLEDGIDHEPEWFILVRKLHDSLIKLIKSSIE
jgi:hypothetical protein